MVETLASAKAMILRYVGEVGEVSVECCILLASFPLCNKCDLTGSGVVSLTLLHVNAKNYIWYCMLKCLLSPNRKLWISHVMALKFLPSQNQIKYYHQQFAGLPVKCIVRTRLTHTD